MSVRDMLEALIAGERDPQVLAELARGRMRAKHAALVEALTGRFDDHHAELARMLLDQIDALTAQIDKLTTRIEELIAAIPAAQGVDADGTTGPGAGRGPGAPALPAVDRLDEITGIGRDAAQVDHRRDRPGHEPVPHPRPPGVLGEALPAHHPVRAPRTAPARPARATPTSRASSARPPPRPPRPTPSSANATGASSRRRGKLKALVAVARSILVIVWHLLADPAARYHDLGADYYASRIDKNRKTRNHVRQLEALGYTVTLAPAA